MIRLFVFLTLISFQAKAITPISASGEFNLNSLVTGFGVGFDDTYRIGDEWGKKPVSQKDLENPHFKRMAYATARVGGATGFYLGYFNGRHVMATNHHVCPSEGSCVGSSVIFPLMDKRFPITEFYGTWPDVDLALFAIDVTSVTDAEALMEVGQNFDFTNQLRRGMPLVTIGFGIGDNPMRRIVGNQDHDCVVFSEADEFRKMADPDDLNPAPYTAWSFANGCDVSHGDSGSAMMDRETGKVIGIIWTGRIPKSAKVQDSGYLDELLANPSEEVWKELSYGVPAMKMKEHLTQLIADEQIAPQYVATVKSVLGLKKTKKKRTH